MLSASAEEKSSAIYFGYWRIPDGNMADKGQERQLFLGLSSQYPLPLPFWLLTSLASLGTTCSDGFCERGPIQIPIYNLCMRWVRCKCKLVEFCSLFRRWMYLTLDTIFHGCMFPFDLHGLPFILFGEQRPLFCTYSWLCRIAVLGLATFWRLDDKFVQPRQNREYSAESLTQLKQNSWLDFLLRLLLRLSQGLVNWDWILKTSYTTDQRWRWSWPWMISWKSGFI